MATGGDLSRTLQGGQEPFYDFSCSLCEEEGKYEEAARYCEECFVYMCDTCVKSHNRIPLNRRHKLLDKAQFTAVTQSALKSFPTQRCLKHPGELINIFCGNHDVVCCSVCMTLKHSSCIKTQHLPDAAKGIQKSKEFQNVKKETKEFLSDLHTVLAQIKTDICYIANEKQKIKQTIADFRKRVNKYFDDLEKKSLNDLHLKEISVVSRLEQDKKNLDKAKKKADDILQQLNSFKGDNECELFFQVKTGKSFVLESVKKVESISASPRESIIFNLDLNIEKSLSSLVALGTFGKTPIPTTRTSSVSSTTNVSSAQASAVSSGTNVITKHSSLPSSQALPKTNQCIKYETQLLGKFDVNVKSLFGMFSVKYDTNPCHISDICQLSNGTILIADNNNKKLKRLDQSYKLLDSVQLPDQQFRVCAAGPGEAAVSLILDKKVQFVSVGRQLSLTSSFSTGKFCRGMVYTNNKLYICCGDYSDSSSGSIEVYNNAGQLQHSLPRASQHLPAVPAYITVSDDGQHLLVTSFMTDTIYMLDLAGNVISTFSSKELTGPAGICTDGRGHVFVSGTNSNTVVQLSPKQQKIEVILKQADGVKDPGGVCYDRNTSRLLVSCDYSDEILAYTCRLK